MIMKISDIAVLIGSFQIREFEHLGHGRMKKELNANSL